MLCVAKVLCDIVVMMRNSYRIYVVKESVRAWSVVTDNWIFLSIFAF